MLSWSAIETGRSVDLAAIVDPNLDPGIPGGRALIAIGEASVRNTSDPRPVAVLAEELGPAAALRAVTVAGAFEILNRIVDATGLPVGKAARLQLQGIIDVLDLDRLPHARH
jgi:hypothetical protein